MGGQLSTLYFNKRPRNVYVPPRTSFVYLDINEHDYPPFRAAIAPYTWEYFGVPDQCSQFIMNSNSSVVLVSSGRFAQLIIEQIHTYPHLSSIYIYCHDKNRYRDWPAQFNKVRGIFTDADELIEKMQTDFEECQPQPPVPDNITDPLSLPNTRWCPWQANTCTKTLSVKGKGTIEMTQKGSIPFELRVSTEPTATSKTSGFAIVLTVKQQEASLAYQINGTVHILQRTTEPDHVLQQNGENWHTYWLTFFKDTNMVKYGLGEVRSGFRLLQGNVPAEHNAAFCNIQYLHLELNQHNRPQDIGDRRDDFRIFIGPQPLIFDPPLLLVLTPSMDQTAYHTAMTPSSLEQPCQILYNTIISWKLDEDFSKLWEAIEQSVRNPNGWCFQKLREKSHGVLEATYLRITVGELEGSAPGHTYVIEVWPPGHYSPIHRHSDTYGIIRVLYGRIVVQLFPILAPRAQQKQAPIMQILDEGEVTWLSPRLNQTHQVRNADHNKCCVTIQSYQYGSENQEHYEYFDYVTPNGSDIQKFSPGSDMNFNEFKSRMRAEWREPST